MLTLTENGFILYDDKVVCNNFILSMLGQEIKLDEKFSLRSFFMMMNNYPHLVKMNVHTHEYVNLFNSIAPETLDLQTCQYNIIFNTFIISDLPNEQGKKFNLIVKNNYNKDCNIAQFHLSDIINCPIKINKFVYPVSIVNGSIIPSSNPYEVRNPCCLFEFIDASCFALFRNKSPQQRSSDIRLIHTVSDVMADDVLANIQQIIEN